MFGDFFHDLGLSSISLFVAMDPMGILPFVLSMTQDMTMEERPRVIRLAMITAFAMGIGFIGIGKGVFAALGIEVEDFMVAGGILLLVLAIRHLMTGKLVELQPTVTGDILGIVPLGTPLVVGPAVLTSLLLLEEQYSIYVVMLSLVLNLAFAWIIFTQANRVARLLREQGLRAASQIASLLLASIAVMMIRRGIIEWNL